MDARELNALIKQITDKLPEALLQNKGFESLATAICRIASYLESEQDERIKHTKMMKQLENMLWGDKDDIEAKPGLVHQWIEDRKLAHRREKLLYGVLTGVLVAITLSVLMMAGVKIK
ncbi:MAG: hypothetical protein V4563_14110 [Pseudomonadota bacterium]